MAGLTRKFMRQDLRAQWQVRWGVHGKILDIVGTIMEASLEGVEFGCLVEVTQRNASAKVLAEVVGFRDDRALLLPYGELSGIGPGASVAVLKREDTIQVFPEILGCVVDPFLNVLSSASDMRPSQFSSVPLDRAAPTPMSRTRIERPLSLGVRALDSLLTMGDGQRMGILAGSGVGKSVLLGMIARDTEADVNVIGLIGERGREVKEFLEKDLGEEGLRRSVVVAVTSDQSPLMKIRAAKVTTALAEYFSAQGKRVLLMMDSLTRVATAQREVGLATGEPPTTKGFPPSVFSLMPKILERSGPQPPGRGNISALYTVLIDGDDFNDPIADAARSILDGHIHLTRRLAARSYYPAIDINSSISRVMADIVPRWHWELASRAKELLGVYQENHDLVQIGAYQPGTNPKLDRALHLMPALEAFLRQDLHSKSSLGEATMQLRAIIDQQRDDGFDHG